MTIIRTHLRARLRPRLGVESLESRCACSAGFVGPPAHVSPLDPPGKDHFAAQLSALVAPHVSPKPGERFQLVVAAGPHLILRVGERFQGIVAHIEGVRPERAAARIDWGNGVRTEGLVRPVAGEVPGFDVIGEARYDAAGRYAMSVQVTPPSGEPFAIDGLAVVEPPGRPPSGYAPDYIVETAQTNSDPAPDAPPPAAPAPVPERTLGDTDGGVPWERQPDPRPTDPATGQPSVSATVELPPVRVTATPAPANGPPAEPPAGPAFLEQAAREPVAVPVAPAAVPPPAVANPRTGGGGTVEPVELPIPIEPPLLVQPPPNDIAKGVAGRVAAIPPPADTAPPHEASAVPAKPKTARRTSLWRNGVAVGLALVFAERLIAARRGERDRREAAAVGTAPHVPTGA